MRTRITVVEILQTLKGVLMFGRQFF